MYVYVCLWIIITIILLDIDLEINVAAIATIFASLAALGGGGFLLTKLDLKIDVGSIGGLGNVIQFLDENMAKVN